MFRWEKQTQSGENRLTEKWLVSRLKKLLEKDLCLEFFENVFQNKEGEYSFFISSILKSNRCVIPDLPAPSDNGSAGIGDPIIDEWKI